MLGKRDPAGTKPSEAKFLGDLDYHRLGNLPLGCHHPEQGSVDRMLTYNGRNNASLEPS